MRNEIKCLLYILLMFVAMLGLTACGKKANEKELQKELNANKTVSTESSIDDSEAEVRHVNYTIGKTVGKTITVDADVKIPNGKKYPTLPITKHGMDDAYIKDLANRLFDNGEYQYHKPASACTPVELDEYYQWIMSVAGLYENKLLYPKMISDDILKYNMAKDNLSAENVQGVEEGQLYVTVPNNDNDSNKDIEEYKICELSGQIDGKDYILYSELFGGYDKTVLYPCFQNESIDNIVDKNDEMYSLNPDIKEEEGLKQAKKYLIKLGLSEYELIDISKSLTKNVDDTSKMNGYLYTFGRLINGIPALQEYVTVYVNSYGVEQVDFTSYYEVGEAENKDTEILSFEQLDEKAQVSLKETLVNMDEDMKIDSIEFRYMTMTDENAIYSYVPVWIYHFSYYVSINDSEYLTSELIFDATTGELIE